MAGTGQDTFDEIMSEEPAIAADAPANAGVEAAAEQADNGSVDGGAQPRNERGQFTAAPQEQPAPQQTPAPAADAAVAEQARQDNRIPLAEHLSEREKRQAAERRAEEAERRLQEHDRRMAAERPRHESQQHPADPDIDPYTDLPGFLAQQQRRTQQSMQEFAQNFVLQQNVRFARYRHGEVYDQAYAALTQAAASDPYLSQRIFASADPAEATVEWYKQQQVLKEIGTDPAAYRQRLQDEFLKDPAFRQKAMDAWRSDAQGNNGQPSRPNPAINLPPSLSRTTGAAANSAEAVRALSGREMFDEIMPVR